MPADWTGTAILAAVLGSIFLGAPGLWLGAGVVLTTWGLLPHRRGGRDGK